MTRSLSLLPFLVLVACDAGEKQGACTDMAASSVLVHLVGEDGVTPIVGEISATDEAGNRVDTECATSDTGGVGCSDWIVGWEVSGKIEIHATATDLCNDGAGSATVDVPVDEAGCHVIPQEITLTIGEWTDLDCG